MRIVVTGAAGFIGSSLCEYLQSHSIEHIGIDNFAYGYRDNVFDSEGSPKFSIRVVRLIKRIPIWVGDQL